LRVLAVVDRRALLAIAGGRFILGWKFTALIETFVGYGFLWAIDAVTVVRVGRQAIKAKCQHSGREAS
jgi:L-lactate permease